MHRRWMAGLRSEQAAHHIVLEDCIAAVEAATVRRDRLEAHIEGGAVGLVACPRWCAPCKRCAGWLLVAAATVIAELGDITRFALIPAAAHGVSRSGSVRALQRRDTTPGRHHESRE